MGERESHRGKKRKKDKGGRDREKKNGRQCGLWERERERERERATDRKIESVRER